MTLASLKILTHINLIVKYYFKTKSGYEIFIFITACYIQLYILLKFFLFAIAIILALLIGLIETPKYTQDICGFVYTKGDNSITKKEQDTLLRYIENTDVHKKDCS